MTKFKAGDKFIPHKPKENNTDLAWLPEMDIYDGITLEVERITALLGYLKAKESYWVFHPDWCEKVEEESVIFVQREVAEIIPEYTMNTSASQHWPEVTFIQQEFPPKQEPSGPATTLEQALKVQELPKDHIPNVGKVIDWEQRRYELAKEFMIPLIEVCGGDWTIIDIKEAIKCADEMIKQLKGNDKAK